MFIKNNISSKTLKRIEINKLYLGKESITLIYKNPKFNKEILYSDIIDFEVVIQLPNLCYYKPNVLYLTKGYKIILTNVDNEKYSISTVAISLNELYSIVNHSRQMQNFKLSFSGNSEYTKNFLTKRLQEYVDNGYQKTIFMKLYGFTYSNIPESWSILFILLGSIFLGLIIYFMF